MVVNSCPKQAYSGQDPVVLCGLSRRPKNPKKKSRGQLWAAHGSQGQNVRLRAQRADPTTKAKAKKVGGTTLANIEILNHRFFSLDLPFLITLSTKVNNFFTIFYHHRNLFATMHPPQSLSHCGTYYGEPDQCSRAPGALPSLFDRSFHMSRGRSSVAVSKPYFVSPSLLWETRRRRLGKLWKMLSLTPWRTSGIHLPKSKECEYGLHCSLLITTLKKRGFSEVTGGRASKRAAREPWK
jgi:hypothetical protein